MRFWVFLFLFLPNLALAQFQVPALSGPVVDAAGMIQAQDERYLEQLILQFQQHNKAQIQVLTVQSLGGVPIEQASIQVVDQWKIGDKKRDDGVLLLVAADEKKIRIEVGQGFEGVLPDIKAKRIISDVMAPLFRKGSSSEGILVGAYQIMKTIDPEFSADDAPAGSYSGGERSFADKYQGIFVLLFIGFILLVNIFGRGGRGGRGGGMGTGFLLGTLLGGGGGGGGGGGWGGGSSGGGGGWSGGGGGFSGGGASGGW